MRLGELMVGSEWDKTESGLFLTELLVFSIVTHEIGQPIDCTFGRRNHNDRREQWEQVSFLFVCADFANQLVQHSGITGMLRTKPIIKQPDIFFFYILFIVTQIF